MFEGGVVDWKEQQEQGRQYQWKFEQEKEVERGQGGLEAVSGVKLIKIQNLSQAESLQK